MWLTQEVFSLARSRLARSLGQSVRLSVSQWACYAFWAERAIVVNVGCKQVECARGQKNRDRLPRSLLQVLALSGPKEQSVKSRH